MRPAGHSGELSAMPTGLDDGPPKRSQAVLRAIDTNNNPLH
jgi:hypothetical protein